MISFETSGSARDRVVNNNVVVLRRTLVIRVEWGNWPTYSCFFKLSLNHYDIEMSEIA